MFSIVIPLYNKVNSIDNTLKSVCQQTYADFEIVVVDDGSTDNSSEAVRKCQDSRIRLISKQNGGVCSARNRGIQEARGEYIALLDADDLWNKDYLTEQVKMIHDFPDAAMWGINFAEVTEGDRLVRRLSTGLPDGYRGYVEHYFEMPGRVSDLFCSSSVVIRKDVFDKVGMFDERIKYAEDTDMWWRIIATQRVAFYDRYMVFYQFDAENRALHRAILLKYWLPSAVAKYKEPIFKNNAVFYRYAMRWAANRIRIIYFSDMAQYNDAKNAIQELDFAELPKKYVFLFKTPYSIGNLADKFDKLLKRK